MKTRFSFYFCFIARVLSPEPSIVTGFSCALPETLPAGGGFSTGGDFAPPEMFGSIWRQFWLGRGQRCRHTSYNAHDSSPATKSYDLYGQCLEILFHVYVNKCRCAHTAFFCISGRYVPSCATPLVLSLYFTTK